MLINHVRAVLWNRSIRPPGYVNPRLAPIRLGRLKQFHQVLFPDRFDSTAGRVRLDNVYRLLVGDPEVSDILSPYLEYAEPIQQEFESMLDRSGIQKTVRQQPPAEAVIRRNPDVPLTARWAGYRTVTVDAGPGLTVSDSRRTQPAAAGTYGVLDGAYEVTIREAPGTAGTIQFRLWVPDSLDVADVVATIRPATELFQPTQAHAAELELLWKLFTRSNRISTQFAAGVAALFYQMEALRG